MEEQRRPTGEHNSTFLCSASRTNIELDDDLFSLHNLLSTSSSVQEAQDLSIVRFPSAPTALSEQAWSEWVSRRQGVVSGARAPNNIADCQVFPSQRSTLEDSRTQEEARPSQVASPSAHQQRAQEVVSLRQVAAYSVPRLHPQARHLRRAASRSGPRLLRTPLAQQPAQHRLQELRSHSASAASVELRLQEGQRHSQLRRPQQERLSLARPSQQRAAVCSDNRQRAHPPRPPTRTSRPHQLPVGYSEVLLPSQVADSPLVRQPAARLPLPPAHPRLRLLLPHRRRLADFPSVSLLPVQASRQSSLPRKASASALRLLLLPLPPHRLHRPLPLHPRRQRAVSALGSQPRHPQPARPPLRQRRLLQRQTQRAASRLALRRARPLPPSQLLTLRHRRQSLAD